VRRKREAVRARDLLGHALVDAERLCDLAPARDDF
jgi:hypothetical protein